MKVNIKKLELLLEHLFIENWYKLEISKLMSRSLVRAELFWKYTHWIIRYKWILANNIWNSINYSKEVINDYMTIYYCYNNNWYFISNSIVSQIINNFKEDNLFNVSILKNIFPTNVLIDYLEMFNNKNIWALIFWTTPKLVWLRESWKRILWTNPFWFTFPNNEELIIADIWMSNVPLWEIIFESFLKTGKLYDLINEKWKKFDKDKLFSSSWNFLWTLLPFWWKEYEHKWFILSLLIELISSILAKWRSDKWDLIIITFSKNNKYYDENIVSNFINNLVKNNIRIPWQESIKIYNRNIKTWFIEINKNILSKVWFSEEDISKIKY